MSEITSSFREDYGETATRKTPPTSVPATVGEGK